MQKGTWRFPEMVDRFCFVRLQASLQLVQRGASNNVTGCARILFSGFADKNLAPGIVLSVNFLNCQKKNTLRRKEKKHETLPD